MAHGACPTQMLVAATMIEVKVRVDDVIDVLGPHAEKQKLAWDGLSLRLHRLGEGQRALDVVQIIASVVNVIAVPMIDQDRVAGKSDLTAGTGIPERMQSIHHHSPAVEQIDFGVRHRFRP